MANSLKFFDSICVFTSICVIISKNPIVSVLFLIALFLSISCHLLISGLSFIGLSYLLVYVGAVSILFLFILMLINIRISELLNNSTNVIPLALIIALLFNYPIYEILPSNSNNAILGNTTLSFNINNLLPNFYSYNFYFNADKPLYVSSKLWDGTLAETTHITSLGDVMYTSYSIWLIITSIILLLAMVGAIVITIKQPQNNKKTYDVLNTHNNFSKDHNSTFSLIYSGRFSLTIPSSLLFLCEWQTINLWDFFDIGCLLEPPFINSDFDDLSYNYDSFGCLVVTIGGCVLLVISLLIIYATDANSSQSQEMQSVQLQSMTQVAKKEPDGRQLDLLCEECTVSSGNYQGTRTICILDRHDKTGVQLGNLLPPTAWKRVKTYDAGVWVGDDRYAFVSQGGSGGSKKGLSFPTLETGDDGVRYAVIAGNGFTSLNLTRHKFKEGLHSAGRPIEYVKPETSPRDSKTHMKVIHSQDRFK